jgi:hypothetical protein
MATTTRVITLIAGRAYSGLAGSLSYRVEKTDLSSTWIGNTSVGVTELGSTGTYAASISTWDTSWAGRIVWRLSGVDITQEEFSAMDIVIGGTGKVPATIAASDGADLVTLLARITTSRAQNLDLLPEIAGLAGRFLVMRDVVTDSFGNITSANLRVYDTSANAATDNGTTGLLYSYTLVNTVNGLGQLTKVIQR